MYEYDEEDYDDTLSSLEDVQDPPVFDAAHGGVWIHDPFGELRLFGDRFFPPCAAWRAMEKKLNDDPYPLSENDYVLVGEAAYVREWGDIEMKYALKKEKEGWSYHILLTPECHSDPISFAYEPVSNDDFEPIEPMGPIAPPSAEHMKQMEYFHQKRGYDVYDATYGEINHSQDGRCAGPAFIEDPAPSFWSFARDRVTLSLELYDHKKPENKDTILLRQKEYQFRACKTPVVARFLLRYKDDDWYPFLTVQWKGEEFIGYDYEWTEYEPSLNLPEF